VASTGGAGHFNPLVPFIEALARRRDDVLIVVPPELETTVAAMGRPFRIGQTPPPKRWGRAPREAAQSDPF
jgi:hypothetical protein